MKHHAARGHTRKHAKGAKLKHSHHTHKHHPVHHHKAATAHGHNVHTKATQAHHAKARGLAIGDALPVCAAEALAMSLRLAGQSVTDADVIRLWQLAGGGEDGVPIAAALNAAARFGAAGFSPVFEEVMPSAPGQCHCLCPDHDPGLRVTRAGLLLGLELPGPHTVLATPDGWWSWGELYCPCEFPDAVVEETWMIDWAVAR